MVDQPPQQPPINTGDIGIEDTQIYQTQFSELIKRAAAQDRLFAVVKQQQLQKLAADNPQRLQAIQQAQAAQLAKESLETRRFVKEFHPVFQKVDEAHPEMGYRLERLIQSADDSHIRPSNLGNQPQEVRLQILEEQNTHRSIFAQKLSVENDRFRFNINSFGVPQEMIIPALVGGLSITQLGERFVLGDYNNWRPLQSLIIRAPLTNLGKFNIYGLRQLKTLVLPDTITNIEEHALGDLPELRKIKLPSKLICLHKNTIFSCNNLVELNLNHCKLVQEGAVRHSGNMREVFQFVGCKYLEAMDFSSIQYGQRFSIDGLNPALFKYARFGNTYAFQQIVFTKPEIIQLLKQLNDREQADGAAYKLSFIQDMFTPDFPWSDFQQM